MNLDATVVAVGVLGKSTSTDGCTLSEWVGNHAVASLESDLRLEGVLTNGTNHLKRNVWAVEETSVIWGSTLVTSNVVLISGTVSTIWIDVNAILTSKNTSEGVTGVINVQVSVEGRGVIKYTSPWSVRKQRLQST